MVLNLGGVIIVKKINKLMILGMLVLGVTGATMINPEMKNAISTSIYGG